MSEQPQKNNAARNAAMNRYYHKNREAILQQRRDTYAATAKPKMKQYYDDNKDARRAYSVNYREQNREAINKRQQDRRALKKSQNTQASSSVE